MIPSSYEQIKNSTTTTKPSRDGCHSIQLRNSEIELVGSCFVGKGDAYVKYHFDNMTGSELDQQMKTTADGVSVLYELSSSGLLFRTIKANPDFNRKFLGIVSPKCFSQMIDLFCSDLVRKCRYIDCALPSTSCFQRQQFATIDNIVKCITNYCESSSDQNQDCNNINAATISKELTKLKKITTVDGSNFLFACRSKESQSILSSNN